ncbi:hypothetical protein JCM8202_000178 [Rhodotorula sphaerocarpa]
MAPSLKGKNSASALSPGAGSGSGSTATTNGAASSAPTGASIRHHQDDFTDAPLARSPPLPPAHVRQPSASASAVSPSPARSFYAAQSHAGRRA